MKIIVNYFSIKKALMEILNEKDIERLESLKNISLEYLYHICNKYSLNIDEIVKYDIEDFQPVVRRNNI